jgi:hypothetical protein
MSAAEHCTATTQISPPADEYLNALTSGCAARDWGCIGSADAPQPWRELHLQPMTGQRRLWSELLQRATDNVVYVEGSPLRVKLTRVRCETSRS